IADCREMGIEVLPPDINASHKSFRVLGNSIRFGLGAVKNVGEAAIESIIEGRREGDFTGIFDFCERVDLRKVNKRVAEALVKCGAFDSTGARRAPLMAGLEDAMSLGQKIQQERESSQVSLFGTAEIVKKNGNSGKLPEVPEWDEKLLLGFEKEALRFFITGHPLSRYAADMKRLATCDTAALAEVADKTEVRLCGIVAGLKEIMTKKGDRMGFVTLEDLVGSVEVVVLPNVYAQAAEYVKGEDPLLVRGVLEKGEKADKVIANEVVLLREVNERTTKRVHLTLITRGLDKGQLASLKGIMERYRGGCKTYLHLVIPDSCTTTIRLPDTCMVAANEDLTLEVKNLLGYNAVSFE
ncbi:MAG TPA: OB-fold nucleic acid binding domain-containing protein, partial [Geobacteraceae bacterium]